MFNLFRLCRKDEISFDIVAGFGNIFAETSNIVPAIMSKQHSTLSKGRNFSIESFDTVAVCGNKVECCFDKVERCFDIVAGVDGALVGEKMPVLLYGLQCFSLPRFHDS